MEIDKEAVRGAIVSELPLHARWMLNGTPLDYDFSFARQGLREFTRELVGGHVEKQWQDLLIFGQYDFGEGGGATPWLGIAKTNGVIYGLDVERDDAMFVVNSSIERFIDTFKFLHNYFGTGQTLPTNIQQWVQNIDPEAYSKSFWRSMIVHCGHD